jgi:SAM-dependent methyltransferase
MDKSSYREMKKNIDYWYKEPKELTVVDVGSYDVNGSYREIFTDWEYIGIDIVEGPNVDKVMRFPYKIPLPPKTADVIISGSCFQYVRNPFKLMKEMAVCLKPSGMAFICAARGERDGLISLPPELCPEGDTEFDCWRFLPRGMESLMEESGLQVIKTYYHGSNCWGIGKRDD